MLVSDKVMVRWNGSSRKWYEDKGYIWTKQGEYFECKFEDVQRNSTTKIILKCDYCGKEFPKEYRNYFIGREIIQKDCCSDKNCVNQKANEVNIIKYGVKSHMKTKESKENLSKLNRTPFCEVIKYCEVKGLILLSTEEDYKNDRSRLKIICKNHSEFGTQDTNFANIKKNKGCCGYEKGELNAKQTKEDGNVVYNAFIESGLIPLFKPKDYVNYSNPLPYICPNHRDKGVQYREYGNLKNSKGCYYCSLEFKGESLRTPENKVFNDLINKGLIPVDGQKYKNKEEKIYYNCVNHPNIIQYTTYSSFEHSNKCCEYCRAEDSLTGINKKFRSSINKWKTDSEILCNYKCIFTNDTNYEIHHLYSYNNIIKDALSNLNLQLKNRVSDYIGEDIIRLRNEIIRIHNIYPLGVCMTKQIHMLFHQLYTKNASEDDFYEFKKRYNMGEFEEILKEVI